MESVLRKKMSKETMRNMRIAIMKSFTLRFLLFDTRSVKSLLPQELSDVLKGRGIQEPDKIIPVIPCH